MSGDARVESLDEPAPIGRGARCDAAATDTGSRAGGGLRPRVSITSSARTMRRPFCASTLAAVSGSISRSRACSRPGPTLGELCSSRARSASSWPGTEVVDPRSRRRAPSRRRGGRRRRGRGCRRSSRGLGLVPGDAASSVTSSTSSRWCGMPRARRARASPCRCPCRGTAAWHRRSRSRPPARANASARSSAKRDLPVPVAPTIATRVTSAPGHAGRRWGRRSAWCRRRAP